MLERRSIRFRAPYSRSLYFVDNGKERGLSVEFVREFERWVNKRYARQLGHRPVTVYVVATTRDKLLQDLRDGLADVATGNLTVTEERLKQVDFVAPDDRLVNVEIVVTGPGAAPVASIDDLSGTTIHVRKTSSYHDSLVALNARFKQEKKALVKIKLVPDALEDEDMLEMLNAGVLQIMVVDEWKAKLWARILPKLKLHEAIVLRPPTKMGWAIRKGSPKLAAVLDEFYGSWAKKQGVVLYRHKMYEKNIKSLSEATSREDYKRFRSLIATFEKYGSKYGFDPLLLAAQGYQESGLDQSKKSPAGAVGVMQLMPATGKEMQVGDIRVVDANIHAGAKYMDHLMSTYFADAKLDEQNRTLLAFASYNAGPGNIAKMRAAAAQRKLDPDQWFNNVEIVTAEKMGLETTTYVRNVLKYYVSYKLVLEAQAEAARVRQEVAPVRK
jgi:membrane-bound lytic murein transglycosylase MltF